MSNRSDAPLSPARCPAGLFHPAPRSRAWWLLPLATLLLTTACAISRPAQVRAGQSEAEMMSAMGEPTGRYELAGGGQRVEYAKGPYGLVTWMVDLDAQGRVSVIEQVLTQANFAQVRRGMTSQELLRLLGRPSDKSRERGERETWSWRYANNDGLWARTTLYKDQVLEAVTIGFDPHRDPMN